MASQYPAVAASLKPNIVRLAKQEDGKSQAVTKREQWN